MVQENEEQYVVGAAVERKRPMTKEDIQKKIKLIYLSYGSGERGAVHCQVIN
jgi:hypothetical protein